MLMSVAAARGAMKGKTHQKNARTAGGAGGARWQIDKPFDRPREQVQAVFNAADMILTRASGRAKAVFVGGGSTSYCIAEVDG